MWNNFYARFFFLEGGFTNLQHDIWGEKSANLLWRFNKSEMYIKFFFYQ